MEVYKIKALISWGKNLETIPKDFSVYQPQLRKRNEGQRKGRKKKQPIPGGGTGTLVRATSLKTMVHSTFQTLRLNGITLIN